MSELGTYKGYPILRQKIVIKGTGDGLSDAMAINRREVETDERVYASMALHHISQHFDNSYTKPSKDSMEEPEIEGVVQVDFYRAEGAVFDERADTAKKVQKMEAKVKARKMEEKGQFQLPGAEDDLTDETDVEAPSYPDDVTIEDVAVLYADDPFDGAVAAFESMNGNGHVEPDDLGLGEAEDLNALASVGDEPF